jgi:hypothetical protein
LPRRHTHREAKPLSKALRAEFYECREALDPEMSPESFVDKPVDDAQLALASFRRETPKRLIINY